MHCCVSENMIYIISALLKNLTRNTASISLKDFKNSHQLDTSDTIVQILYYRVVSSQHSLGFSSPQIREEWDCMVRQATCCGWGRSWVGAVPLSFGTTFFTLVFKRFCTFSIKIFGESLKLSLPYDPAIPFPGIGSKDSATYSTDTHSPMFISTLFAIARKWEKPAYPLTDGWMDRGSVLHIHYGILVSYKQQWNRDIFR